jgi:Bacterial Ig-like domain
VASVVTYNRTTHQTTLNPNRTLAADTIYVATLTSAITSGKPLALSRWSFTTGPRPTLAARTPGINARKVNRAANVKIRFSEKVSAVSGSSLMLVTSTGRRVPAVVTYNRTTGVATLNPVRTLAPGTRYTVVVTNAIKDRAGNRLTATRWSFTTA